MATTSEPDLGTAVDVRRLAAALGAEVRGLPLAGAGRAEVEAVSALLLRHRVLFFPGQHLTMDQHVALAEQFGPLEGHPHLRNNGEVGHPSIFELMASTGGIADEWHSDLTFLPQPSVMSVLNMVRCPEVGGDTLWANLELAYEELSAPMRDLCDGLTALHDATPHGHPEKATIHPVVRVHPVTGRRALYVNEHFTRRIVELSAPESDMLLRFLTGWITQPRFTVRYHWTPGTIAIWDNRCTQHTVLNDFEGERIIQRATVMGDQPHGAPPRWEPFTTTRGGAATRHDRQLRHHLRQQAQDQA